MNNPEIKFVCPECGHDQLVEIRGEVQVKVAVVGFFVNEKPTLDPTTDGPRFAIEEGEELGRTDGKVIAYRCDACGFTPMTQARNRGWPHWNTTKPKPIVSKHGLHQWLKRNKMLRSREMAGQ